MFSNINILNFIAEVKLKKKIKTLITLCEDYSA